MLVEHNKAEIYKLVVGEMATNCYLLKCKETGAGLVIDPGGDAASVLKKAGTSGCDIKLIILTHGHCDHIIGVPLVKEKTLKPVCIHAGDAAMLTDAALNLSAYMGNPVTMDPPDRLLKDQETVTVGKLDFSVNRVIIAF